MWTPERDMNSILTFIPDWKRFTSRVFASVASVASVVLLSNGTVHAAELARSTMKRLTPFEQRLINLPPDTWFEAPGTAMQNVCPPASFGVNAVMGCTAIIEAWGGGAYDSRQRKMLVWGGGHNDYWGNEIYGFDLRQGRWERLTDPTQGKLVSEANSDPLPDGQPNSRHTYDGMQYITHRAQTFAHGGAISPGGGGTAVTWLFDSEKRVWTAASTTGGPGGYALASAYDPASRLVIVRATKGLWSYDADANQWQRLIGFGYAPNWPRYEVSRNKRGAVDTKRQLFWSVGSNDLLVWDIQKKTLVTNEWVTIGGDPYTNAARLKNNPLQVFESGGGDIFNARGPGFDYDSKADQFVAWKGGAPSILDLSTKTWHTGSKAGSPLSQARNGTFGRWRYVPEYNVFLLVNSASSNVFFYKNTAGAP